MEEKKKKKELTSVGCNVNISCGFSLSTLTINKSLTEIIFMHLPILSKFYPDNYHISKLFKKKKIRGKELENIFKIPKNQIPLPNNYTSLHGVNNHCMIYLSHIHSRDVQNRVVVAQESLQHLIRSMAFKSGECGVNQVLRIQQC